jgi:hypothetical protein
VSFYDTPNQYHRTTLIIDTFDDGSEVLVKNERILKHPPCAFGAGCRAADFEQEACEFDPKTGLCGGRMA